MKSVWVRWLASVVFGILAGRLGYGIVGPFILPTLGADPNWVEDTSGGYGLAVALAVIVQIVVAVVVTVLLARIANIWRLLGWGCVVLGGILILNVVSTAMFSGLTLQDFVEADTRAKNDAATAFWFWVLAMAIPYVASGLVLFLVGFFLLRSGRRV
ncbi:hypothetical protein [Nitratireductor sp. ZSWI3]|uniref:hypothetical protein n=1 Tax=Nitratireductor sp. ZSWI3 TaxID=2966359 RepID=UPI00214FF5E9|nr:hypothetical protein [Nitratireductor sp. ZSWI3]MCR4266553.1 hypothetical protein [Nitratireductor sp. ZSWI3]